MHPWTERLADRLQFEIEEFSRRGLDFKADSRALEKSGRLTMSGHLTHGDQMIELQVVYPDTFPYMRPQVFAPGLELHRHQNPYNGNLCLLDRSSRAWDTTASGAWLVSERVPYLLELLGEGGSRLRENEVPQGEPLTTFIPNPEGAVMFVPSQTLKVPEEAEHGVMTIGLGMRRPVGRQLRGAILSVNADEGAWQSEPVEQRIALRFAIAKLSASWVRLQELPTTLDAHSLLALVRKIHPPAAQHHWSEAADGEVSVVGLLVPEEVRQDVIEPSWVFLVHIRPPRQMRQAPAAYVMKSDRLSAADLQERTPALAGSTTATVALAGLGSLGAPLALELARAQVGSLRLLDCDRVDAGNIVRWPFGLTAAGYSKSNYLANHIATEYPLSEVRPFDLLIGEARLKASSAASEAATLEEFLNGAQLILDATGELAIAQLLADEALQRGVPLLSVWGTEGGWGGGVAEINPEEGGCWFCLQLRIADGSIPAPPAEANGLVQPRGCAAPTFTASSFDMLEIVVQAMRAFKHLLLDGASESVVHIERTRDDAQSELPAPLWSTHRLKPHPECSCCSRVAEAA